MYNKRVKIFVILIAAVLFVYLLRLIQMQLLPDSSIRGKIAELERQRGLSQQLNTVRGRILDRKGEVLAVDELRFQLHITYRLGCFWDERVRKAKLLQAAKKPNADIELSKTQKEIEAKLGQLQEIIEKCTYFGAKRSDIENRLGEINNRVWNLRTFLAWLRNNPDTAVLEKYNQKINSIPQAEAIADFEKRFPDENKRLLLISGVDDIADMDRGWQLLELKTDNDIFTAQLEFMEIDGIKVLPRLQRVYPYGTVAAQTIGWVGPVTQEADKQLFAGDRLSRYLADEVCGREDGVEYTCEPVLRGRRGEAFYDANGLEVECAQPEFGKDVSVTLDIKLQQRIEKYLANCGFNPHCKAPIAVVVIDVATDDILALVSMPVFDLNRIRWDYEKIASDIVNQPLLNRAINKQYPPGSVVKPLILVAGLESGKITANEIISCPAAPAPQGWPNCWIYNKSHWRSHDDEWKGYGGNNAHNAVKGSCNIYFSRLADRIDPSVLQQWLFKFGYGQKILSPLVAKTEPRNLRQAQGQISNNPPKNADPNLEMLPPLYSSERKWFGIGQGNLRTTPLQVANAMAALARGGIYKPPRLFISEKDSEFFPVSLNISPRTLNVVRDGMSAVVNEPGGTAYDEFAHADFAEQGVRVYGKTGSTEGSENAWFAGFAEGGAGRGIAIAVVVEGGRQGSKDAAPLAREVIQFCIEAGYIGR